MKPKPRSKPKSAPTPIDSHDLCIRLVSMAAFSLSDQTEAQNLVYEAVRTLQRLDAAARDAGVLPKA